MYFSSVSSRLLLHDVNTWELKRSYGCYEGLLRDITWSDDAKYLLQVNPKGLVEILVTSEVAVRCRQHIPLRETWSACFHREGHRNVAIGTRSGNVLIWDIKNKSVTKTFPTSQQNVPVNFVCYDAKNANLAANQHNGDTTIYGLTQNMPLMTIKLASSKHITAMKYHHECRSTLGFGTEEGHLILRDIVTNADIAAFQNVHFGQITDFLFSPLIKDVVISSGLDKTMNIYDCRFQNVISSTRAPYSLTTLASKPSNENQMALGTVNGLILIYDLRDLATPLQVLEGHKERVNRVSFQPIKNKTIATEIDSSEAVSKPQRTHSPEIMNSPQRLRSPEIVQIPQRLHSPKPAQIPQHLRSPESVQVPRRLRSPVKSSFYARVFKDHEKMLILRGLDPIPNNGPKHYRSQVNHAIDITSHKREPFIGPEKSKISMPLLSKMPCAPGPVLSGEFTHTKIKGSLGHCPIGDSQKSEVFNSNTIEDLKKHLTVVLAEVGEDNRNYFLNVMMALTKQKLELDKQLTSITSVLKSLMANQSILAENNRRLNLELDQIKSHQIAI